LRSLYTLLHIKIVLIAFLQGWRVYGLVGKSLSEDDFLMVF
jgi:hypothetical protein